MSWEDRDFYGDWYHDEFLGEDPDDYNEDLEPLEFTQPSPEITDRNWSMFVKSDKPKWVYMVVVGKQSVKIGSCNPSIKHLKNRICEAKRWNANAKLLAVKLNSSVEEEKFLHKALNAEKEIVMFSNSPLDKARLILIMSRFTFVSGKIKNLKINSEPVKFNDILINVKNSLKEETSAYCECESEIYKKLKLLTSGCRLDKMLDKMGNLGWLWIDPYADEDEYGNVIPGTSTDGKHCKMIDCVFNAELWQQYVIEEGAFYTNTKIKRRK